jgi:hypothetical protein
LVPADFASAAFASGDEAAAGAGVDVAIGVAAGVETTDWALAAIGKNINVRRERMIPTGAILRWTGGSVR